MNASLKEIILAFLSLSLMVSVALARPHHQDDTAYSEDVALVGPHPEHGSFTPLSDINECPSYCYNFHTHVKGHITREEEQEAITTCIRACRQTKLAHPGVQHTSSPQTH